MDKIIEKILSSSGSENDLRQLRTFLTKEEGTLVKHLSLIDDALSPLDPTAHSLGYAYLLATKTVAPKLDVPKFIGQVQRFVKHSSASQIRLVPAKFVLICRKFAELVKEARLYIVAVKTLAQAITKLRTGSDALTPLHSDFLMFCLLAKTYHAALPLLEEEIFEISQESTINTREILLYYYYGGMAYTGLKEYKKALHFFKLVVSTPASILSAIMVEAYKKFILVSLLVHGRVIALPRYTSPAIQRHHKTAFPQYQEFANAYTTNSTDDLHKVAETHAEVFQKDKNFGLVKQCIQSLYRRNIQRLTQTYITLSLQDIATTVKLPSTKEVEKYLLKMIESGEIHATINQKDGMVSFSDDPEKYDTSDLLNTLDSNVQKVIQLGKRARVLDESIASSVLYLQKTSAHERGRFSEMGAEEFADGAEKMPFSGGPPKAT